MNTLVYKRTHRGDPNKSGVFGVYDCMGQVRGWNFNAVIGVGGKSPWRGHEGLAYRINWIGINPTKKIKAGLRGPLVTFQYFVLCDQNGPELKTVAPRLFKYMFEGKGKSRHHAMSRSLPGDIQAEITKLLTLAEKRPKTKRFPLINATCVPPNYSLNMTVRPRTTKRCRCPN